MIMKVCEQLVRDDAEDYLYAGIVIGYFIGLAMYWACERFL